MKQFYQSQRIETEEDQLHCAYICNQINKHLERLSEYLPEDLYADTNNVRLIKFFGITYLIVSANTYVEHEDSEGFCTITLQQVPSANEMTMEVTKEYVANLCASLESM
jgi:hypothetical protein